MDKPRSWRNPLPEHPRGWLCFIGVISPSCWWDRSAGTKMGKRPGDRRKAHILLKCGNQEQGLERGRWRRRNRSSGPGMRRQSDLSLSRPRGVGAAPRCVQSENRRGERSSLFDKESKLILLSKEGEEC